jgi:murein DD-endopeptidase MepM/ murein hydrolase activator NlpD
LLFAVLASTEIAIRTFEKSLSIDLLHIRSIPRIAKSLAQSDGVRVLFLGNSMTREGLDIERFSDEAARRGYDALSAAKVHPDDTTIAEWPYLFRHYFVRDTAPPDALVVGFANTNLEDRRAAQPDRIGHFYSDLSDTLDLFENEFTSFGDRAAYLLSHASSAYANRERVSRRIFDLLVPGYRKAAAQFNETVAAEGGPHASPVPSYRRLRKLIDLARENHTRLILVAMPTRAGYDLEPHLLDLLDAEGVPLIDARDIHGLGPEMFRDGLHMTPRGAQIYTRRVAQPVLEAMDLEGDGAARQHARAPLADDS